jgi:hypothetical protein
MDQNDRPALSAVLNVKLNGVFACDESHGAIPKSDVSMMMKR